MLKACLFNTIICGLYIFTFILGACEKKQFYPLPEQPKTKRYITGVQLVSCDFSKCINDDPDLKPDLYLQNCWLDSVPTHYYYSDIKVNSTEAQLPIPFVFSKPVLFENLKSTPKFTVYVRDQDTGTDDSFGGLTFTYKDSVLFSKTSKLALKLILEYK